MNETPIPKRQLAAAGRVLRFQVLAAMNSAFAHSGLTYAQLASRLDWPPYRVRQTLKGKRRLTLRVIGEMFFAIDGSLLKPEIVITPRDSHP